MSIGLLLVLAAIGVVPIVLLVRWSISKSGRLKQDQIDHWTPVAQRLGGVLEQHEGRWQHHVLRADVAGVAVHATISHQVSADANIAASLKTNNEFRTQVHAPTRTGGPTFLLSGTVAGRGKLGFGQDALRQRFRVDRDTGLEGLASDEVQELLLKLHPHFQDGAQLVSEGHIVSLLFASNTTDAAAVEQAVQLVGAVASA